MKIKLLGAHNTESLETRMSGLLIDGALALDAGGLTSSLTLLAQHALKAVLLTHQHYDHIRDIPALAMSLFLAGKTIPVYATEPVIDILTNRLFDGDIYPKYLEHPAEKPTVVLRLLEPLKSLRIEGYTVLPVPVPHSKPTVGFQITPDDGKTFFYTGDTGPGLNDSWQHISPELLITEVTASNRFDSFGKDAGHMTPNLLKEELVIFRETKGYLPPVVIVHMSPGLEEEITPELAELAAELNTPITPGREGMELSL